MSESQLTHTIKTELHKINYVIDNKIVRGLPYDREARYHKNLLERLSLMRKKNWLARSMRYVSAFMF